MRRGIGMTALAFVVVMGSGCKPEETKTTPADSTAGKGVNVTAATAPAVSSGAATSTPAVVKPPVAARPTATPEFKGSADDLATGVKADAAKFDGKLVQVVGTTSTVHDYNGDNRYMFTIGSTPNVQCAAHDADQKAARALSIEQEVTVLGTCKGLKDDKVLLTDCWVVATGADPAQRFTAADYAKAKSKVKAAGARGDYRGPLVIEGKVASSEIGTVFLEGAADDSGKPWTVKLMVGLGGDDGIKTGDHVVARGVGGTFDADTHVASVNYAVIQR